MKKFYFLFFISFSLSAQIRAVVKDSISGQPIPYVTIWVENETIGTTSEIDGRFSLNVNENKRLVFSALGYEIKNTTAHNEVIFLKPKIEELKEVIVQKPHFKKEIEIGSFDNPNSYHISGDIEWTNAKFFKYETKYDQTKFLKKIKITTRSKVKNAKFKIRILGVDANGFPADDLINESIIQTVKAGKAKNIIDVSKFKLEFPKEGLFIAYEVLKIESNKYSFKYTEMDSKKTIQKTYYAPDFEIAIVNEQNSYHFRNGKWIQFPRWHNNEKRDAKKFNNKFLEPAFNLILTN